MIAAFRSLVVAVLFQVFMVSGSKAEPIDNIDDWLKRFQYAAAKSDIQGMIDIINANRDPRMDTSRIKPAFDTIINPSGRQPVSYASLLRSEAWRYGEERSNRYYVSKQSCLYPGLIPSK